MTKKGRKRLFMENGSKLLEEMLTSKCRCNPIRSFSADQILDATDSFKSAIFGEEWYEWHNGVLDGQPVIIKKHDSVPDDPTYDGSFRDITISSQMSSQKYALKLLGCCLEFVAPVLVYERAENGPLSRLGDEDFNGVLLSWERRLRIARDVARAITYLHTAFHRPIVHRDIKPGNIFLDENYVPKLSAFDLCIVIPEGETQVEDTLMGTVGFVDPLLFKSESSYYSEYSDVYSFGVFLLILLTGKESIFSNQNEEKTNLCRYVADLHVHGRLDEIVDRKIWEADGGINEEKKQQFLAFMNIALSCIQLEGQRPLMIDVAKELAKIERSANVAPAT